MAPSSSAIQNHAHNGARIVVPIQRRLPVKVGPEFSLTDEIYTPKAEIMRGGFFLVRSGTKASVNAGGVAIAMAGSCVQANEYNAVIVELPDAQVNEYSDAATLVTIGSMGLLPSRRIRVHGVAEWSNPLALLQTDAPVLYRSQKHVDIATRVTAIICDGSSFTAGAGARAIILGDSSGVLNPNSTAFCYGKSRIKARGARVVAMHGAQVVASQSIVHVHGPAIIYALQGTIVRGPGSDKLVVLAFAGSDVNVQAGVAYRYDDARQVVAPVVLDGIAERAVQRFVR